MIRISTSFCVASILCAVALAPTAALAQAKTAKACDEEWTAKKADIQKSGQTKKDFVAKCRAGTAAAPAAAPASTTAAKPAAPAPAAAVKPAAPAAPAPTAAAKPAAPAPAAKTAATTSAAPEGKPGRAAMVARERACGADWKADKAANKVEAGMTWPKYWSECDKRKKAAGM